MRKRKPKFDFDGLICKHCVLLSLDDSERLEKICKERKTNKSAFLRSTVQAAMVVE